MKRASGKKLNQKKSTLVALKLEKITDSVNNDIGSAKKIADNKFKGSARNLFANQI